MLRIIEGPANVVIRRRIVGFERQPFLVRFNCQAILTRVVEINVTQREMRRGVIALLRDRLLVGLNCLRMPAELLISVTEFVVCLWVSTLFQNRLR